MGPMFLAIFLGLEVKILASESFSTSAIPQRKSRKMTLFIDEPHRQQRNRSSY